MQHNKFSMKSSSQDPQYFKQVHIFRNVGKYRQTSTISCTLVGNKIVDHSDVVGASTVGAAPTTSSFWT